MDILRRILNLLEQEYKGAGTALKHSNGLELLIATILSAQCTDKRVNQITPALFEKYHTALDYAQASLSDIQELIQGCGLHRNKARFIRDACRKITYEYDGFVPQSREELMGLPGVGRKTANVVLATVFKIPTIAVDTHVFRVANRLGLAESDNVLQVEKQLMSSIPREKWSEAHHWLIHHGRNVCKARNPRCDECSLRNLCRYASSTNA